MTSPSHPPVKVELAGAVTVGRLSKWSRPGSVRAHSRKKNPAALPASRPNSGAGTGKRPCPAADRSSGVA